jgi:steroid delta-isomerase-like uncharacterized protein
MQEDKTVTVKELKEIMDAFNRHDIDAIMHFFADDCTFDVPRGSKPWGRRLVGKDEVRDGIASRFSGIPDVHYGNDRHFVSGGRGSSEWRLTGTTNSGQLIDVQGCDLWEFQDGKVIRKDSYWKIVE